VIAKKRPILILDEPQKDGRPATQGALQKFTRCSSCATPAHAPHSPQSRLHRLDASGTRLTRRLVQRKQQSNGVENQGPKWDQPSPVPAPRRRRAAAIRCGVCRILEPKRRPDQAGCPKAREGPKPVPDLSKGFGRLSWFVVSNIDARDDTVHFTNGRCCCGRVRPLAMWTERDIRP